jgi:hypothetical protein
VPGNTVTATGGEDMSKPVTLAVSLDADPDLIPVNVEVNVPSPLLVTAANVPELSPPSRLNTTDALGSVNFLP